VSDAAPISPFDEYVGTEWGQTTPERATARIELEARHMQPAGLVHGGVLCTLAESITSRATYLGVREEGKVAMGQSHLASFLRPISAGHANAVAHRRHAGRSSWVWDVEVSDDEGRLCALVRVTVAVRPAPGVS
jgi:1,4-dihydroxy-2-naphthoyl-CoA hydrolase